MRLSAEHERRRDRRSRPPFQRLSNASMRRHRVIRKGADHCLAKRRPTDPSYHQSTRLSASTDNNENGVTWCVKRSILDSSFLKKDPFLIAFYSESRNVVIFYSISKLRKFSRTVERYIRTKYLTKFMFTKHVSTLRVYVTSKFKLARAGTIWMQIERRKSLRRRSS